MEYPKKNNYKGKKKVGMSDIELTPLQKEWYELGYYAGYVKALNIIDDKIIDEIEQIKKEINKE